MSLISDLAIRSIALGVRPPRSKRINDFRQLAKTIDLLKELEINVFLDVGANRGSFAKRVRDAGYAGHIFSFEPIKSECEYLGRLTQQDPNWIFLNYALGSEVGTKQFNIVDTSGYTVLSSFLKIKGGIAETNIPVDVKVLDDVLPAMIEPIKDPRIFLKMDTQGFDHEVVKGASRCMDKVLGLQSEISVVPLYEGMRSYTRSLEHYHELGFSLVDLFVVNRTGKGLVLEYDCLMKRG